MREMKLEKAVKFKDPIIVGNGSGIEAEVKNLTNEPEVNIVVLIV